MFVAAQAQLVQLHLRGTTANVQTQLNNRMRLDLSTNALTGDVTINGGGTRAFNLSGIGALSLDASTSFRLYTPGIYAGSVETGYVLRLRDDANGDAEYVPVTVNTTADLKSLPAGSTPDGWIVTTLGHTSESDGGGASYRYWASSTETANDGTVIDPTFLPGRFLMLNHGAINVTQFGAFPDDATIDTEPIRRAVAAAESGGYRLEWPSGTFLIDGTLTNNKSEWAGMRTAHLRVGSGFNTVVKATNWNVATSPRLVLFEATGPSVGAPWIHDMQFEGNRTNTVAKLPITSVFSSTQFTVSTNTTTVQFPSASQTNVWPYYGFVFFYSPQGHFLGRSVATDISTSGTNYVVTLAGDTLWHATKSGAGGLLTTDLYAVFSPTVTTSGTVRMNPAGAGVTGIEMTGSFGGKLDNIGISGFHTGIAFSPASSTHSHILSDIFVSGFSFAGFASPTRGFNGAYDYVANGYLFATGFMNPAGTDLTLTNGGFVAGGFSFYNLPEFSKYDYLWSDGSVIGQFYDSAGSYQTDYLLSDNTILHGIMVVDGLSSSDVGKSIYTSSARLRALAPSLPQYKVDQPGSAVWVRGSTTAANLSFGQLEINPGRLNNFAQAFDITNAVAHRVAIGHLADSSGYTNFSGAGTLPPIVTRTDLDPTSTRYTGMHYGATNLLYTVVNGVERGRTTAGGFRWLTPAGTLNLAFDSDGLFIGSSTNYSGALTSDGARAVFHNGAGNAIVNAVANGGASIFSGWASGGTVAAPTATGINTIFTSFQGKAYDGSAYGTPVRMLYTTEEAQTGSARGSRIDFETTPIGSTTRAVAMRIRGSGQVQVGTGGLTVAGTTALGSTGTTTTRVRHGVATLVGGTVTVSDSTVTANSRIFPSSQVDGGTPGWLRISGRTASTSFTITSSSGTDTSTVAWLLVEP